LLPQLIVRYSPKNLDELSGGALGGFVGGVAAIANGRIFRSDRGSVAQYGLAALITVSAVVLFFSALTFGAASNWSPKGYPDYCSCIVSEKRYDVRPCVESTAKVEGD
jgi:hypothetical protein